MKSYGTFSFLVLVIFDRLLVLLFFIPIPIDIDLSVNVCRGSSACRIRLFVRYFQFGGIVGRIILLSPVMENILSNMIPRHQQVQDTQHNNNNIYPDN